MATTTTRLGLTKPDGTDNFQRTVLNGNWDAIDAAVLLRSDLTTHENKTATTSAAGHVQLSSATNSTSATLAATPAAVKAAYDLANTANTTAGTANTTANTAKTTADTATTNLTNHAALTASTTASGHVQLNNTTTSTATNQAATANAVKTAYDLANTANTAAATAGTNLTAHAGTAASTTVAGHVMLSTAVNSTSTTMAATPSAVKQAYDMAAAGGANASAAIETHAAVLGTTSAAGHVQLTNSTTSTSTTTAATPNSVKQAYDLANTANTRANALKVLKYTYTYTNNTAGTTTYTIPLETFNFSTHFYIVSKNTVLLEESMYTISGRVITFTESLAVGDTVTVRIMTIGV